MVLQTAARASSRSQRAASGCLMTSSLTGSMTASLTLGSSSGGSGGGAAGGNVRGRGTTRYVVFALHHVANGT